MIIQFISIEKDENVNFLDKMWSSTISVEITTLNYKRVGFIKPEVAIIPASRFSSGRKFYADFFH